MAKLLKGLCYTAAFVILAGVILAWIGTPSKEEQVQDAQVLAAMTARANIADVVLAGSENRDKIARKDFPLADFENRLDALKSSSALDASARQIQMVEASPMATHDLDIATTLDEQRKDLASALNSWNAKYNRPQAPRVTSPKVSR
jgi:hypothetical protein